MTANKTPGTQPAPDDAPNPEGELLSEAELERVAGGKSAHGVHGSASPNGGKTTLGIAGSAAPNSG